MTKRSLALSFGFLGVLLLCGNAGADPGILLEVDTELFELGARDLRAGVEGPSLRVVIGSPGNPTPSGNFPLYSLVRNPRWTPGRVAREAGASPLPASADGPMGVAKLPFAKGGFALHGGAHPLLLGKPVSLGCVRMEDRGLGTLIAWLEARGALASVDSSFEGELQQQLLRPARLVIR